MFGVSVSEKWKGANIALMFKKEERKTDGKQVIYICTVYYIKPNLKCMYPKGICAFYVNVLSACIMTTCFLNKLMLYKDINISVYIYPYLL